jgi:hypothetical protein
LALIVDKFTNLDEDKTYLNNIINRISTTKSPIVILTSKFYNKLDNLEFAKTDNVFNNSQKTVENYFTFTHIDTFSKTYHQRIIYLVNLILVLHIHVQPKLISVIRKEEYDTSTIIRDLECLLYEDILSSEKTNKIIKLAVEISFHLEFNLESILYFLYNTFRFDINSGETHLITTDCLDKLIQSFAKIQGSSLINDLSSYYNSVENTSFYDTFRSKIVIMT